MKSFYSTKVAKKSRVPKPLRFLLIIGLTAFLLHEPLLISYGRWLAPSTPNPTGDIAVALAGPNRLETAATLLAKRQFKAVYLDSSISEPAEADQNLIAEIIAKYRLSPHQIYWGGKVKNTFDEALAFQRTMNSANFHFHQIVIVSDRYHLRRSQWAFRQVLEPNVKILTYATPAMSDPYWWHDKKSRKFVSSETRKLIFYWLYYGLFKSRTPLSPIDFTLSANS